MHQQFYRFVLACRKSGIKYPVRTLVAETLIRVAKQSQGKEAQEAIIATLLSKELMDALQYSRFDISQAEAADLAVNDETYDGVDHILAVCTNVATASGDVMQELSVVFILPEYWGAWMILQEFTPESLKAACELYAPSSKGIGEVGWRAQLEKMRRINPPVSESIAKFMDSLETATTE